MSWEELVGVFYLLIAWAAAVILFTELMLEAIERKWQELWVPY